MSHATRRALIVEPSRAQRSVLVPLLRDVGAEVVVTAGMASGLRQATEQRFDLICVSAKLRDGTGLQFCSALRATPQMSVIPVLVLLADHDPDQAKALRDSGATEVLGWKEIERIRQFVTILLPPLPVLRGQALIVEDNAAAAQAVLAVLRGLGLEAKHVSDPNRALSSIRSQPIDLIITAAMPDAPMTGAAMIREVRALPGTDGRTPILAIAAQTDPIRRVELLRSGADEVISEPVLGEELTVQVERLLRSKRRDEESEKHRATYEALALTDPLTTLNNRRFLGEIGPMYCADARRHGFPLSLIVVDIDHFDAITRTYEPAVCEEVLRSLGRLLRSECRRGDVAVRCRDHEFMLLLSHCGIGDATLKADALRVRVAGLRPCGVDVTVSVGVAELRDTPEEGFTEVFKRATQAAHIASRSGRDQVVISES